MLDTGSQVTTIGFSLAKQLQLELWPLQTLGVDKDLELIGAGDNVATVFGWVSLDITIPRVERFKDRPYPVIVTTDRIQDSPFHITLGTNLVRDLISLTSESELASMDDAWNQAVYSSMRTASAHCEPRSKPGFNVPLRCAERVEIPPYTQRPIDCRVAVPDGFDHTYAVAEARASTDPAKPRPLFAPVFMALRSGSQLVTVFICNPTKHPKLLNRHQIIGELCSAQIVREHDHRDRPQAEPRVNQVVTAGCATLLSCSTMKAAEPDPATVPPPEMDDEERKKVLLEKVDFSPLEAEGEAVVEQAKDLFTRYHDVFSLYETDLGKTNLIEHTIKLEDSTPFKERFRRIPPHLLDEVKKEIKNMLKIGVIKPSESPWTNAVVLARKKEGELRMCIDFRKLNARTTKDAYAIPRIDEVMTNLAGSSWFSSLDLKSGFWQTPLAEESKPYTAFTVGPLGFFQFERMPFGLCNAPATFQRLMENALADLNLTWCIIYIDDVVVYAGSVQGLLQRLEGVFQKLREAGLKLKPSKCNFFARDLAYLGHTVSEKGIAPDPKKIQKILDWPIPTTPKEVKSFLGFAGYYRRFVKGFSKLATELSRFTKADFYSKPNQDISMHWNDACQESFDSLKRATTTPPVLAFADYTKPFRLVTDACMDGLGAALYQKSEDGLERPIAFASTSVKGAERNYPAHKLEFFALRWAITQQFKEYLWGQKHFEVNTDNNPLTYVLTTANLDACGHRWIAELANFNFSIKYVKGKTNVVADALSRIDWHKPPPPKLEAYPEPVQALTSEQVSAAMAGAVTNPAERPETVMVVGCSIQMRQNPVQPLSTGHVTDWNAEQRSDPMIAAVLDWLTTNENRRPSLAKTMPAGAENKPERAAYTSNINHFRTYELPPDEAAPDARSKLVLYRVKKRKNSEELVWQFVVPKEWRGRVLKGCHDDVAHMGAQRVVELLIQRFWWPGMTAEAEAYCKKCLTCIKVQAKETKEPLVPLHATAPGDLYHVDFTKISAPTGSDLKKDADVMVITDHFTRFAQAYVCENQSAEESAGALFTHINMFGVPARILTDQGKNFESALMKALCTKLGIKKLRTSPAHPQTNGQVERFNRTLFNMLKKLEPEKLPNWDQWLTKLVNAYNCTRNSATGYSPYFLFFGRRPRLELDRQFPLQPAEADGPMGPRDHIGYVTEVTRMIEWTQKVATETAEKEMQRHKKLYDRRVRAILLAPGDKVLVKLEKKRTRFKLVPAWEDNVYTVVEQVGDLPVYRVQRDETGAVRTLHRNKLFPLLQYRQDSQDGEQIAASERAVENADNEEPEERLPEHEDEPATGSEEPRPSTSRWPASASAQVSKLGRALQMVGSQLKDDPASIARLYFT